MPELALSDVAHLYIFIWKDRANTSASGPSNNQYNQSCLSSANWKRSRWIPYSV